MPAFPGAPSSPFSVKGKKWDQVSKVPRVISSQSFVVGRWSFANVQRLFRNLRIREFAGPIRGLFAVHFDVDFRKRIHRPIILRRLQDQVAPHRPGYASLIEIPEIIIYFASIDTLITGRRGPLHEVLILICERELLAVDIREGNVEREPAVVGREKLDPAVIASVDLDAIQGGL